MKAVHLLPAILLMITVSCNNPVKDQQSATTANDAALKATLENISDQCWNKKDKVKLRASATENFIRNVNDINIANTEKEMEAAMQVFFTGFPDLHISLDNPVVKNRQVFTRWTATGTNTGVFGEVPATGKKVSFSGYSILYFDAADKLTREDVYYNELKLLQQLGYTLLPPVVN